MSVLAELPELAAAPSVITAAGLVLAGAVATGLHRRAVAEVCVAWALGFLVLHLLVGLLGGAVATNVALGLAVVAVLIVAAPLLLREPAEAPQAEPAPAPVARPAPSTHLWSADGYRDVTGRSAP